MRVCQVIPPVLSLFTLLRPISPIFSAFFPVFCAFSPPRRDGSNEPQAGTQGQPARVSKQCGGRYVGGSPNNVAPIVSWLCSPDGRDVTGRVFLASAGTNGFSMGDSFHVR